MATLSAARRQPAVAILPEQIQATSELPPTFTALAETTWATYQRVDWGYRHEVPGSGEQPPDPPLLYDPIPFSQHDPRWAALPLGSSTFTVTSSGCAVTAAAMLITRINYNVTPEHLVRWLNTHNGFTSGGLLRWHKIADFQDGLEFVNYHLWRNAPADLNKLRSLLDYGPQIVQVDHHPGGPLNTHFVLATAMASTGGSRTAPTDVTIIDPYTGNTTTLLTAYARPGWDLARAVYALAEYRTVQP